MMIFFSVNVILNDFLIVSVSSYLYQVTYKHNESGWSQYVAMVTGDDRRNGASDRSDEAESWNEIDDLFCNHSHLCNLYNKINNYLITSINNHLITSINY